MTNPTSNEQLLERLRQSLQWEWTDISKDALAQIQYALRTAFIDARDRQPVETSTRIPPANPRLDAHINAVADFMQELAPYLGLDDGLVSTRDFIDAARRIREWCHDHQTLPKLEYSDHCDCCVRNKITVDAFSRPAVESTARKATYRDIFPDDPTWWKEGMKGPWFELPSRLPENGSAPTSGVRRKRET